LADAGHDDRNRHTDNTDTDETPIVCGPSWRPTMAAFYSAAPALLPGPTCRTRTANKAGIVENFRSAFKCGDIGQASERQPCAISIRGGEATAVA